MNRESVIAEVNQLAKDIKRPIPINQYIRSRIVQDEIVNAYKSPVPTAVIVNGKSRQVEIGDWIAIHPDGSKDAFKDAEFKSIFEPLEEKITAGGSDARRK